MLFTIGAVFFRAPSIHDALLTFKHVLKFEGGQWAGATAALVPILLVLVVVMDLLDRRIRVRTIEALRVRARLGAEATPAEAAYESVLRGIGAVPAGALLGLLAVGLVVFGGGAPVPFIYFHF